MKRFAVRIVPLAVLLAACADDVISSATPHIEVDPVEIDLGTIPLYEVQRVPVTVRNTSRTTLEFTKIEIDEDPDEDQFTVSGLSRRLTGGSEATLMITIVPVVEGDIGAVITIESNDTATGPVDIRVTGEAVDMGRPDIVVEPNPIVFGSILEDESTTVSVRIQNVGDRTLEIVRTYLDDDTPGVFEIVDSLDGAEVPPVSAEGTIYEKTLLVRFTADGEDEYEGNLVIDSNDPDERPLVIPLRASTGDAPIAIAAFRGPTPADPYAPFTNPEAIIPLDTVYLDGSASYDPNGLEPLEFIWSLLERPEGSTQPVTADSTTTPYAQFFVDLAGHYKLLLTVKNTASVQSGQTEEAILEFDAVPDTAMHVQLVWDHATSDLDLHLVDVSGPTDSGTYRSMDDCFFSNRNPSWYGEINQNPTLDIDDINGLGPENINIRAPHSSVYRVYVHNYRGDGDSSLATVRIYLNGVLAAEMQRSLDHTDDVWEVADIVWPDADVDVIDNMTSE